MCSKVSKPQQPDGRKTKRQPENRRLSLEDGSGTLNALDLDENEILNNKIDSVLTGQMPLVVRRNRSLTRVLDLDVIELDAHCRLVYRFQQAPGPSTLCTSIAHPMIRAVTRLRSANSVSL